MRKDTDSAWKDLLERYFEPFLAFFFPAVHADIDWDHPPEFLDKELQRIVRASKVGRRLADKLVKVWLRGGTETWLLIHVEVQRRPAANFSERIFIYNYRIFDRYHQRVVSLVVLTDVGRGYQPCAYHFERWGFAHTLRFPVVKLADYRDRREELEKDPNPFALVVLAHLAVQEAKGKLAALRDRKLRLVRLLYRRGHGRDDVVELLRFLDWLLALPEEVELEFWQEVTKQEESESMPHVLSIERIAEKRGRAEGKAEGRAEGEVKAKADAVLAVLEVRALALTEEQRQRVLTCKDLDRLDRWHRRAITAASVAEVLDGNRADANP